MKFALVNNSRCEASPGLAGFCRACAEPVIAKCGPQRVWHWAHRSKTNCDPWWEPETLWHRAWKDQFHPDWQEVIGYDEAGEKHIADVKTERGLVIELQHSHLRMEELAARESFHRNMVWVVDGTRLKRDRPRFLRGVRLCRHLGRGLFVTHYPEECLPPAWLNCTMPVFFDFDGIVGSSESVGTGTGKLWCLLPQRAEGQSIIAAVSRGSFIDAARKREHIIQSRTIIERIATILALEHAIAELSVPPMSYRRHAHREWTPPWLRRRRQPRL